MRLRPISASAFFCTTSLLVMTSMTVGEIPPPLNRLVMAAPNLAIQRGIEPIVSGFSIIAATRATNAR